MKKMNWIVPVVVGIALGMFAWATGIANSFLVPQPAFAQNSIDVALTTILTSQTRWQTVQGEAEFL